MCVGGQGRLKGDLLKVEYIILLDYSIKICEFIFLEHKISTYLLLYNFYK